MIPSIEQHADWIADCLAHMRDIGARSIEAQEGNEDEWIAHVADVASISLRSTCSSWYVGANIPGRPRVFMPYIGGFPVYVQKCTRCWRTASRASFWMHPLRRRPGCASRNAGRRRWTRTFSPPPTSLRAGFPSSSPPASRIWRWRFIPPSAGTLGQTGSLPALGLVHRRVRGTRGERGRSHDATRGSSHRAGEHAFMPRQTCFVSCR